VSKKGCHILEWIGIVFTTLTELRTLLIYVIREFSVNVFSRRHIGFM